MTAPLLSRLNTHRRQREARGATEQEVQLLGEAHAALAAAQGRGTVNVLQLDAGSIGHRIITAISGPEGRYGMNPSKLVLMLMPDVHHSYTERAVQELARQGLVYSFPGLYGTPVLGLTVPGEQELARLQTLAVPG